MSNWSLKPATFEGGTIVINSTAVAAGGHTSFSVSEKPTFRDTLVGANFPYADSELAKKQASGSIEYVLPSGATSLPIPATKQGTLAATFVGLTFSGNVRFTGFKADFKNSESDNPTASIDWETIDGAYTLTS